MKKDAARTIMSFNTLILHLNQTTEYEIDWRWNNLKKLETYGLPEINFNYFIIQDVSIIKSPSKKKKWVCFQNMKLPSLSLSCECWNVRWVLSQILWGGQYVLERRFIKKKKCVHLQYFCKVCIMGGKNQSMFCEKISCITSAV